MTDKLNKNKINIDAVIIGLGFIPRQS